MTRNYRLSWDRTWRKVRGSLVFPPVVLNIRQTPIDHVASPMSNAVKVLVVEDDAGVRGVVVHIAKTTLPDAHVTTACNGREALA